MSGRTLQMRSGRQSRCAPGHPWIYKTQLRRPESQPDPGAIVTVVSAGRKYIGTGYYNSRSEIAVRLLTRDRGEAIDRAFFLRRIAAAQAKRERLAALTDAYRIVFSEADGLPGLIVDRYGETIVFQLLTLGMERLKIEVTDAIREVLKPRYLYEKDVSPFRRLEGLKECKGWWGAPGPTVIEIHEGKRTFLVDIDNGHKTGFYLDQRRSRQALESLVKGKTVLDLFAYTGAFAVTAAACGASAVTAIDIKEEWLARARENAALNGVAGRLTCVAGDAFAVLENLCSAGTKFDIIILDPPSFLHARSALPTAVKGYRELNTLAMRALADGGVLATFSCSHHMPNDLFARVVKEAAAAAGKTYTILKRCHQAEDHPIVREIPETEYLKGYFLRLTGTATGAPGAGAATA